MPSVCGPITNISLKSANMIQSAVSAPVACCLHPCSQGTITRALCGGADTIKPALDGFKAQQEAQIKSETVSDSKVIYVPTSLSHCCQKLFALCQVSELIFMWRCLLGFRCSYKPRVLDGESQTEFWQICIMEYFQRRRCAQVHADTEYTCDSFRRGNVPRNSLQQDQVSLKSE